MASGPATGMSLPSSFTAVLSPTASEGYAASHALSASLSSLSSSVSARHAVSNTSKTYRQASTLFLTRRLPEALSTVLPLITPGPSNSADGAIEPTPVARASRSTRIKVWSLYLTILNAIVELEPEEGKEAFGTHEWRAICNKVRDGEIWEEVVRNGYHGVEGDVDSDVVINLATLLLAHARTQQLNQKRLENFLASSTQPVLDLSGRFPGSPSSRVSSRHRSPAKGTSGANTPRDLNARVKILELYTLHVLLRNNEWDYAREFISVSSVLDEERREAFLQALSSLQEEQQEAERSDLKEKERQEEQLRHDLEEARRLRVENEEREKRRLEEERTRRAASEVDYGIERSPALNGSANVRQAKTPASNLARRPNSHLPRAAQARGSSAVLQSFGARAAMVMTNLRALVERLSASFQADPAMLMRMIAFIMGLILVFGRRKVRERVMQLLAISWNKVRATAGMGVKISYI